MIKTIETAVNVAQTIMILDTIDREFRRCGEDEMARVIQHAMFDVFSSAKKTGLGPTDNLVEGTLDEDQLKELIDESGQTKTETLAFDMDSMDKADVLEKITEFLNKHEVK